MRAAHAGRLGALLLLLGAACDGGTGPEPRVPTSIAVTSAPQSGTVGEALVQPLRVSVTDQDGEPLAGALVRWSVVAGGGSIAPDSTTTDAAGVAEAVFTLGPLAGEHVAVATLSATVSVRFEITATGGAPAALIPAHDSLRFTAVGDTVQLTATVKDRYGNVLPEASVVWTTSSSAVVSVSSGGIAQSRGAGTAELHGASGSARVLIPVRVAPEPATLTVTSATDTLRAIGASADLTATVADANGNEIENASITWSTGDTAIVAVDDAGRVTARAPGAAAVTAEAGAASAQAVIVVQPEVASVELLPSADTLTALGDTLQLTARALDANGHPVEGAAIAYASNATGVATVDDAGRVVSVAQGSATITARSGRAAASAAISVQQTVARIAIGSVPDTMRIIGSTATLSAQSFDANGHAIGDAAVTWSSVDADVATVGSSTGIVSAVARGDARIVASAGERADTVTVRVIPWGRVSLSMELIGWEIHSIVFPILQRYGMTANLDVITSWVGDEDRLSLDQIRELHAGGWAIVPHSVTLPDLTQLSDAEMRAEIVDSKAWVADHGFRGASTFVVPLHIAGERERAVIRENFVAARAHGYEAVNFMVTWPPEDPYSITALQGEDYIETAALREYMLGLARRAIHEGLLLEIFFHRVRTSEAGRFEAFIAELAEEKEYVKTFSELFEE